MKKSQGGKRKGAGRKPISDKKETITLYIRKSTIKTHGGEDYMKTKIYSYLGVTE